MQLKLPLTIQFETAYTTETVYVVVDRNGVDVAYSYDLQQVQEVVARCNDPFCLFHPHNPLMNEMYVPVLN